MRHSRSPFKFVGKLGVMAEANGFYTCGPGIHDPVVGRLYLRGSASGSMAGTVNSHVLRFHLIPLLARRIPGYGNLGTALGTFGPGNGILGTRIGGYSPLAGTRVCTLHALRSPTGLPKT